jgi:S-adenosylmethionine:tRNA ribosyltransferase-isomerase
MDTAAASTGRLEVPLPLTDFQFALPPELIAQEPAPQRDQSRLLILDRGSGTLSHSRVDRLPTHLRHGDLLVVNDTRVIPARLRGRTPSGGTVELLVLRAASTQTALCLGRPARRLRLGATLLFPGKATARVIGNPEEGRYTVIFEGPTPLEDLLAEHGEVPLPPYIRRPEGPHEVDRSRYQSIFARVPGAIAAPTASLHFSDELLGALRDSGIDVAKVTLHVGPGTFLPVRTEDFREHVMDPEWYDIPATTAEAVRSARADGRRVVAVGTTTTRALESAAGEEGVVRAGHGWARLFITPGYRFRAVDVLFTNFHLPGSTLLLMVSAFAGRNAVLTAYADAVACRYRFYSYGDAMLIQ